MIHKLYKHLVGPLVIISLLVPMAAFSQIPRPVIPNLTISHEKGVRGNDPLDKLAPELRMLYEQFTPSRGGEPRGADETGLEGYTSGQLKDNFGIKAGDKNPVVTVAVNFTSKADVDALTKQGLTVIFKTDKTVYGTVSVQDLANMSGIAAVSSIGVLNSMHTPSPTKEGKIQFAGLDRGGSTPTPAPAQTLANRFNKQGLTGKGTVVGVIDTGIDWRHQDFIRPDGTSRILAIWDIYDDSYLDSKGKIGTAPPVVTLDSGAARFGTVYTNAQINAALKGAGTVNTGDHFGHGTAVAGTALGNGRATAKGVPAGTYEGVAPDADLIVVRASECGGFHPVASITAGWITEMAKSLGRPVVINMSFGGQFSSHDGSTVAEQFIDNLVGAGKPGVAVTVSAGNDGRYSLHSAGKFGPKRIGQKDNLSEPIELVVKEPSTMLAVFDSQDDWGLVFQSDNEIFQGVDGKPTPILIFKNAGRIDFRGVRELKNKDQFQAFCASIGGDLSKLAGKTDVAQIQLPVGDYWMYGFGSTANVKSGRFDLYSVEPAYMNKAIFGMGTEKTQMVGSPGNAKNAITVGSFDFRNSWENLQGETAFYNLVLGGPSSYTSPGYRRDGVVKPDISAPARYTISSLSESAKPASGGCEGSMASGNGEDFTKDGFHIAWDGTSAASPFAAGVIALMLEKNPTLDAEQIRQILRKSARKDSTVGGVPNAVWGWGMLDPAAAIAATPPRPGAGVKRPVKGK